MAPQNRSSCVTCARRKVKCDKQNPCSNCVRNQTACAYRAPVPSLRHRNRLTNGDLLSKIQELESILHSHSIPFDPLNTSWIQSPWEEKLTSSSRIQASHVNATEATMTAETGPETQEPEASSRNIALEEHDSAARLWSGLSEDLRTPVVSQLNPPNEDRGKLSVLTDPALTTSCIITPTSLSTVSTRLEIHPDPKNVFKLWQTFVENVNPLAKIIHTPTLQDQVLEAAWSVELATKALEATMLAVYALAVSSMKPATCIQVLGETKPTLLDRYRTGALHALAETDLLSTQDLGVLQAFTLVLMIDHQSDYSTTAAALALRIAHRMGLHRADTKSDITFFQREMQVRLWWYIRTLDSRARRRMGLPPTVDDLGDIRLPMNVNDADLHPQMTSRPAVQHTAATEMVYCMMKYELWNYVRKSSNFADSLNPRGKATQLVESTSAESLSKKKKVVEEVESMLRTKYLEQLDMSIPIHHLSAAFAGITIHTQRFRMFHPRHQPDGGRHMSQADQDLVFESSVRLLELDSNVRNTNFSLDLVDHMTCRTQVEALVYMVSELRRRTSGDLVETAWARLSEIHNDQPIAFRDDHKFYAALADLTLEAWEARRHALKLGPEAAPPFIEMLQVARGKTEPCIDFSADAEGVPAGFLSDPMEEDALDWTSWNDILQL